jgi:hypothetical protein
VSRPRPIAGALLFLHACAPAPAQVVTARGLLLDSPTLVSVEVPDEDWSAAEPLRFTGDQYAVTRVEDPEWDGPGVAVYCVVFKPRPALAPPAPFLISGARGTCILLSWLDLSGVRNVHERGDWEVLDPRDINRDKLANVLDFWALERLWSSCAPGGDFNLDGACDVRDFESYLSGWRE